MVSDMIYGIWYDIWYYGIWYDINIINEIIDAQSPAFEVAVGCQKNKWILINL